MIKLEVSKHEDGRKTIYYRDEDDIAIRVAYFDCNGKLITEELAEFNIQKQILTRVKYAGDSQTVLGYRQYYYDQFNDKNEKINFEDFKLIDGKLTKTCQSTGVWLEKKKAKCIWYDGDREFLYYEIYQDEDDGCGMNSDLNHYDQDGKIIEYGTKKVEIYR